LKEKGRRLFQSGLDAKNNKKKERKKGMVSKLRLVVREELQTFQIGSSSSLPFHLNIVNLFRGEYHNSQDKQQV